MNPIFLSTPLSIIRRCLMPMIRAKEKLAVAHQRRKFVAEGRHQRPRKNNAWHVMSNTPTGKGRGGQRRAPFFFSFSIKKTGTSANRVYNSGTGTNREKIGHPRTKVFDTSVDRCTQINHKLSVCIQQ